MIRTSIEGARGCGYRQEGGLYLVAPSLSDACPLLPIPLEKCPHCGQGIGPSRSFTWVTPSVIVPATVHGSYAHNATCPLGVHDAHLTEGDQYAEQHHMGSRAGLIWVGSRFYTAEEFVMEAAVMGVSRRITAVPRGFEIGETWVLLGHRDAIPVDVADDSGDGLGLATTKREYRPGIITAFQPTAVEYIVKKGEENDEDLHERLRKRGIEPVKVVRKGNGS